MSATTIPQALSAYLAALRATEQEPCAQTLRALTTARNAYVDAMCEQELSC